MARSPTSRPGARATSGSTTRGTTARSVNPELAAELQSDGHANSGQPGDCMPGPPSSGAPSRSGAFRSQRCFRGRPRTRGSVCEPAPGVPLVAPRSRIVRGRPHGENAPRGGLRQKNSTIQICPRIVMRREIFLACTVGPAAAARLRRPAEAALACLTETTATSSASTPRKAGGSRLPGRRSGRARSARYGSFTVLLGRLARTREADLAARPTSRRCMADGGGLAALLPPFAAAHRARAASPVIVANDWLGFRQLYWWRGDGAAAVSTSARALSVLGGRRSRPDRARRPGDDRLAGR